jgi:hypothetical protein
MVRRELEGKAMNIWDYYIDKFNATPDDTTFKDLPVKSVCGEDCKNAIDAMASYIEFRRRAIGDDHDKESDLMVDLNEVIGIFWRG